MSSQAHGHANNSTVLWPPGTVLLDDMRPTGKIILQPRPSEDPNDPLNWSNFRKFFNFGIVCFYIVMVCEFISAATPTWGPLHRELGFSYAVLNDSYAAGNAFLALGCLLLIPFAHKFGRRPLYLLSTLAQFGVSIWQAKMQTVPDLILVNILECLFGSLGETIVQMTIADVFFVHQRGRVNGIYIWLWKTAGALGSLIAGYIAIGLGWRWIWWLNAIIFGAFAIVVAFGYEETKYDAPVLQAAVSGPHNTAAPQVINEQNEKYPDAVMRVSDADKHDGCMHRTISTGATDTTADEDLNAVKINHDIPVKTYSQRLALMTPSRREIGYKTIFRHMYQPLILLVTIPAVTWVALVYGILIALQDVMSATLSTYMTRPPYNFDPHQIGLMRISNLVGILIGSLAGGFTSDWIIVYSARKNRGVFEPEFRLWSIVPFVLFVPAGAVMYGIGLNNGASWPVIAVGLALYYAGVAPISSITITYLTDSYKDIIGDSLVGVTFVRNAISAAFVFALDPWIREVSIKWCLNTILLIANFVLMFLVLFIVRGRTFRMKCAKRYVYYARQQFEERH